MSDALRIGLSRADKTGHLITYRYIRPCDDIEAITELLHQAYAPLADKGMRFVASHQDAATTRRRMARGETIAAEDQGVIVGVVTLKDAVETTARRSTKGRMSLGLGSSQSSLRTKDVALVRPCWTLQSSVRENKV
jgi:hypothetical protein